MKLGSAQVEVTALQSEAREIKESLAALEKRPDAPKSTTPEPQIGASEGERKALVGEPWLKAAMDLLFADAETVASTISKEASTLLQGLSNKRLQGLHMDLHGGVAIQSAEGTAVPWNLMPDAARQLAYTALKASLVLAVNKKSRMPFVVLGSGLSTPDGQDALGLVCQHIGQHGQAIQIVSHPDEAPLAKHVVTAEPSA